MEKITLYEQIGGAATVRRLVEAFYPRVQADPELQDLFPADIQPVLEKQYRFLTQFFGGPPLYSEAHGQPMLRARHLPFPIDEGRARAWLRCMAAALAEAGVEPALREQMWQRLAGTAAHMINTPQTR